MFLKLAHTNLDVFQCTRKLVLAIYSVTKQFPDSEKYCLTQQLRRAGLSIHLNLAEGCSRKSFSERRRYYEISRGSVIEVDTAFDIAFCLSYCNTEELKETGQLIVRSFSMLSELIDNK